MIEDPERHSDRPEKGADLSPEQRERASQEESLNAAITYEVIRREGSQELERPTSALAWSGLAAGLSMGFSFVAVGLLHAYLPEAPWRPLIANIGYTVGFLIVILASQQLFTENTLKAIVPVLARPGLAIIRDAARLWATVLAANLAGALLFAWVIAASDVFPAEVHQALGEVSRGVVAHDFWTTLLKGVFAGWLIAMMVWMLPAAEMSHVSVILIVSYVVALGDFLHIVAGASEVFYLAILGQVGWLDTVTRFFVPVLIGNVVGGVALVSALNHAQVVSGKNETRAHA